MLNTSNVLYLCSVATALTTIADKFHQLDQQNWIVSSFNLTAAAFIPFWGSMADIFGRHGTVQVATILMLIGSALCTAAPTNAFGLLLFGRAVQGIACAGLDVVIRVILADKVSLRESATNWTIFSTVGGISYGLGPIVGGLKFAIPGRGAL